MDDGNTKRFAFCSTHPVVSYVVHKTKSYWKSKIGDESTDILIDSIGAGLEQLDVEKQIDMEKGVHNEMCFTYPYDLGHFLHGSRPLYWDTYTFREHGEFLVKAVANFN